MPRARMTAIIGVAVTGALAFTLIGVPAASANSVTYGRVVHVGDGDTVDVDIAGDGTRRPVHIRYVGVQATEMSTYSNTSAGWRGECWSVDAATYLSSMINGKRVRLTSRLSSSHSGARLHRSIAFRKGGYWVDSGSLLVSAGLVLPDTSSVEWLQNGNYQRRAQRAAAARLGMWGNPTHCGVGPAADLPLTVKVRADAPGNDAANVNGEYVRVTNRGTVPVDLGTWWVRDNAYRGYKAHGYTFPGATIVNPGQSVSMHPGKGVNTATNVYWGLTKPIFENPSNDRRMIGDGAYLFDPLGNLRAWAMYPNRLK